MHQDNPDLGILRYTYVGSPLGDILIAGDGKVLRLVGPPTGAEKRQPNSNWLYDPKPLRDAARQLTEYFSGTRREFDLPLAVQGTAFQKKVWRALTGIPYGETVSYFELACRIDRSSASRAVGAANARNPLPIIVPCHRVVGKSGASAEYSVVIRWRNILLQLEGARPPELKATA